MATPVTADQPRVRVLAGDDTVALQHFDDGASGTDAPHATGGGDDPRMCCSPAARSATGFDPTPVFDDGPAATDTLTLLTRTAQDIAAGTGDDEIWGEPDGPPIRLPQGVVLQKQAVGTNRVTPGELLSAVAGINALPPDDIQAIARQGVPVHLLPVPRLELNRLGATKIVQDTTQGPWRPARVRIAVRAGLQGIESTSEIVQHELGHVLAVLRRQDGGEDSAIAYAQNH